MMDRSAFTNGMRKLSLRFKEAKEPVMDAYYDWLKTRLTNDQFIAACEKLFAEAPGYRLPKPADFVLAAPAPKDRTPDAPEDPYMRRVERILRGSDEHKRLEPMFEARHHRGYEVPSYGPAPFFFPRPTVEIVDDPALVGISFELATRPSGF